MRNDIRVCSVRPYGSRKSELRSVGRADMKLSIGTDMWQFYMEN